MSDFLKFLTENNIKYKLDNFKNGEFAYKISVEHEDIIRRFLFTIDNDYKIEDRKGGAYFKIRVYK